MPAHNSDQLTNVERVVSVSAQQVLPTLSTEFSGAKLYRFYFYAWVFTSTLFYFCLGCEQDDVIEPFRARAVLNSATCRSRSVSDLDR